MKLNVLAGTLFGFAFSFLVFGLIKRDFEWIRWVVTMAAGIGGIFLHLTWSGI